MRFLRILFFLAASVVCLVCPYILRAAADPAIAGRLIFETNDFACDQRCSVTLLASGVRPIQTVMPDLGGHFTFNSVPRGFYSVKVEVEGFETVIQPIDSSDGNYELSVLVPLLRKPSTPTGGGSIVNVSEFLDRYPKKAVSSFGKGTDALKKNKYEDAVKFLRNAVELAPTFYEAHNQLGIAYRETGRRDDAESEFIKAHELNSTNVEPLLNLTKLYLEENEPDRAVTTGEQAIKANSNSGIAFFSLGIALYKAAQLDRAEAALERALTLAPKIGNIRLMLANVYLKLQRYDSTLDQLNKYITENPKGEQLQDAEQMRDKLMEASQGQRP